VIGSYSRSEKASFLHLFGAMLEEECEEEENRKVDKIGIVLTFQ
jgi:hypothetical protein